MLFLLLSLIGLFTETIEYRKAPEKVILMNPQKDSIHVFLNGKEWQGFKLKGDTLLIPSNLTSKSIKISYKSRELKDVYFLHSLDECKNNGISKKNKKKPEEPIDSEVPIKVVGTKSISITTSGGGVNLSQGMYVNLSGYAGNVLIEGVIENSGTEKNYSTLKDLDQAYLKLRGRKSDLQIGVFHSKRYDLNVPILGITGQIGSENSRLVKFTYGEEKGLTNRMIFQGEDGAQGPYVLKGANGETDIEVIEGTERVYIDGVLMKPGKRGDYILDTGSSTIVFTPRRPILKGQKIEILFQYRTSLWKKRISQGELEDGFPFGRLHLNLFEEKDIGDPKNLGLADWQMDSLKAWGDSAGQRDVLAAFFVGEGKGSYKKEGDHFLFVGQGKGDYNLQFTYVGEGRGSYSWDALEGGYTYVGEGNGAYLPEKKLNAPSLSRLASVSWLTHTNWVRSKITLYGSERDLNTFSDLGDADNWGKAADFKVKFPLDFKENKGWIELGGSEKEKEFYHPSLRWNDAFEEWFSQKNGEDKRGGANFGFDLKGGWGFLGEGEKILKGNEALSYWKISLDMPIPRPISLKRANYQKRGVSSFSKREDRATWRENIFGVRSILSFGITKSDSNYTREFKEEISKSLGLPIRLSLLRRVGMKDRLDMATFNISKNNGEDLTFSLNSSYLIQPKGEELEKRALFSLDWRYSNSKGFGLSGEHQLNASSLNRKEERFVYVGLGNGDYSYDPDRNKYVPERGGDFRREFTNIVEISPATLVENLLGINLGGKRTKISASLLKKNKYPGVQIPYKNQKDPFYDEENIIASFYLCLTQKIGFSGDFKYLNISDGEIAIPEWINKERSSEFYLVKTDSTFSKKLGVSYALRMEGIGDYINWGNKDYGTFIEIKSAGESKKITLRLTIMKKWVKDMGISNRWIPFKVVSLKPTFLTGYKNYKVQVGIEGQYGMAEISQFHLSPLFPSGWSLRYNLHLEKPLSKKTRLSLEIIGDRKEGYPQRENLSLSLFTDF